MAVLCQYLFFERTGIDADADGDTAAFAGVRDRLDAVVGADIAGVDADLVYAGGR